MRLGLVLLGACSSDDGSGAGGAGGTGGGDRQGLRVAQYNIELLNEAYFLPESFPQLDAAVAIINRFDPDVIAINEVHYDVAAGEEPGAIDGPDATTAALMAERLNEANTGAPYAHTLMTLGNWGFDWPGYDAARHDSYFAGVSPGNTPGVINIAVVSRHPIVKSGVRVITDVAWDQLPDNTLAELELDTGISVPAGYPVISNAIVVAPIDVDGTILHLVLQHTVPPVNHPIHPHRNHDQIVAMRHLIEGTLPGEAALPDGAPFVVMGDLNADPEDGDSLPNATGQLLDHPSMFPFQPEGAGTVGVHAERNSTDSSCPAPGGPSPGQGLQFQLDYLLPAAALEPLDGGMFFPDAVANPADWELACNASNHMMLWADLPL